MAKFLRETGDLDPCSTRCFYITLNSSFDLSRSISHFLHVNTLVLRETKKMHLSFISRPFFIISVLRIFYEPAFKIKKRCKSFQRSESSCVVSGP